MLTLHEFIGVLINIICLIIALLVANYLYLKKGIGVPFSAVFGMSIFWGLGFLCARLFSVFLYIVSFNGGIPWQRSGRILAVFFICVTVTLFLFFKDASIKKKLFGRI